jgi:two-component sensor histidine kinase
VSNGILELEYNQHDLRFDFTAPVFNGPSFVKFRYKLEGQDIHWSQPSSERYTVYTNLAPGRYIFKVIACNDAGVWSAKPACYHIILNHAFWQTWYFWLALTLVLGGFFFLSGYFVMSKRKQAIHDNLESEKKFAELQLISIRHQIDPHFTFNAMNSIASVIMKEEKEKAYNYFVKLANLIRQVLASGDKLTRSLSDEMVIVRNYLEIEKFRFGDSFTFNIDIIGSVNFDQEVPKKVIQTFVENALKHGLRNKQTGTGIISITIHEADEKLSIVVEDNGIGREKAKEFSQRSSGRGIEILTYYYNFLDRSNNQHIRHEITDLYNEMEEPSGTRVTIIIPLGFKYKMSVYENNQQL